MGRKRHPEVHLLDFKPRNGSGLVRLYQYQHHEAVHADVYGRYNNSYLPRYRLKSVETLSERRKLKKIKAGMPRLPGSEEKIRNS